MLSHFYIENTDVLEIGVDEAGRGPLFGRVYAGAVILPKDDETFDFSQIKDSKKFTSAKKLENVANYIKEHAVAWAVAFETEKVIDNINILQATQKAMHSAIRECRDMAEKKELENIDYHLMVDGNYFNNFIGFDKSKGLITSIPHTCVKGGDNVYSCIAAASILAKTHRDAYIEAMCDEHPWLDELYSIRSNKGYGAKKHMTAIQENGVSQWHRRSFAPCKTAQIINIT
jgi:ribonuclease HII